MIRTLYATAALAMPLALLACAPTETAPLNGSPRAESRCFNADQVRNFRQGRVGQVFVRAASGDVFEIESSGGCTGLDFANRLAIVPSGGGLAGTRICTLDAVDIAVPGTTSATDVCRARVMRVLTDEEIAALPSHQRP